MGAIEYRGWWSIIYIKDEADYHLQSGIRGLQIGRVKSLSKVIRQI